MRNKKGELRFSTLFAGLVVFSIVIIGFGNLAGGMFAAYNVSTDGFNLSGYDINDQIVSSAIDVKNDTTSQEGVQTGEGIIDSIFGNTVGAALNFITNGIDMTQQLITTAGEQFNLPEEVTGGIIVLVIGLLAFVAVAAFLKFRV